MSLIRTETFRYIYENDIEPEDPGAFRAVDPETGEQVETYFVYFGDAFREPDPLDREDRIHRDERWA